MSERTIDKVQIDLDDVESFIGDDTMVQHIESNTSRYLKLFYDVVDSMVPATEIAVNNNDI